MSQTTQVKALPTNFGTMIAEQLTAATGKNWLVLPNRNDENDPTNVIISRCTQAAFPGRVSFEIELNPHSQTYTAKPFWGFGVEYSDRKRREGFALKKAGLDYKTVNWGEISFTVNKTIPTIVKDLTRRLLPAIEAPMVDAYEKIEALDKAAELEKERAKNLAAILDLNVLPSGLAFERYLVRTNPEATESGHQNIHGNVGLGVTLTLSNLTDEMATAVMEALKPFQVVPGPLPDYKAMVLDYFPDAEVKNVGPLKGNIGAPGGGDRYLIVARAGTVKLGIDAGYPREGSAWRAASAYLPGDV